MNATIRQVRMVRPRDLQVGMIVMDATQPDAVEIDYVVVCAWDRRDGGRSVGIVEADGTDGTRWWTPQGSEVESVAIAE